jgi:hypothetical protein
MSFDSNSVSESHKDWLKSVEKKIGLGELNPQPYWGFDDLYHTVATKLLNCFYVIADSKRIKRTEYFLYESVLILQKFSFDNFLNALENAHILVDFDARTGHNHGTKFRLRQNKKPELYNSIIKVF